ncbi:hypothetical protein WL886_26965 [Escherichia coli]|uniref:Prophage protein n=1 Tax=Escherichia coli TaxID=562 RepID=A0AAW6VUP9_ECOLX|nr:hypothetical protein [Escherichia coli]EFA3976654.1 hypothetical protein [Escherichia coli]EFA5041526.1 hypothetical protein [Escherichia coli]EFA9788703.1 hypothetical protein [Escherichia coli]EFD7677752.1 hypothetical protein [Escherichia coli]EFH2968400.1 hypothetical protein [Escherichia coli]
MRIRIINNTDKHPEDYLDCSLAECGISVWDEFDVMRKTAYGYVVIHNGDELFVRRSECVELIEENLRTSATHS